MNGIFLKLKYIPIELYQDPIVMNLSKALRKTSNGRVDINCLIAFTVGGVNKKQNACFYDYKSKFKDSWFSVYFVMNDKKGKKFMLKNNNLNFNKIIDIPILDQKIIVTSLNKNIIFKAKKRKIKYTEIKDQQNRKWKKIEGEFNTISALPDKKARIKSIKLYLGKPEKKIYNEIEPFHDVILSGTLLVRRYRRFWAIVVFNGSKFTTKSGRKVDTFKQTNLEKIYYQMVNKLVIKDKFSQ